MAYTVDEHDLPTAATLTVGSLEVAVTPELHAPVMIQSPDGVASRFPRSMVRVETPDGRVGRGWLEFNFPVGAHRVEDTRSALSPVLGVSTTAPTRRHTDAKNVE